MQYAIIRPPAPRRKTPTLEPLPAERVVAGPDGAPQRRVDAEGTLRGVLEVAWGGDAKALLKSARRDGARPLAVGAP